MSLSSQPIFSLSFRQTAELFQRGDRAPSNASEQVGATPLVLDFEGVPYLQRVMGLLWCLLKVFRRKADLLGLFKIFPFRHARLSTFSCGLVLVFPSGRITTIYYSTVPPILPRPVGTCVDPPSGGTRRCLQGEPRSCSFYPSIQPTNGLAFICSPGFLCTRSIYWLLFKPCLFILQLLITNKNLRCRLWFFRNIHKTTDFA